MITELNVPGIKLEFLKRPHDLALRLLVQDLFLVDRIQTFGPEYELVVCSSGRSLLGLSPTPSLTTPTSSWESPSVYDTATSSSTTPFVATHTKPVVVIPSHISNKGPGPVSRLSSSTLKREVEMSELLSDEASRGALLTLSYEMLKPQSPYHPAVQEAANETGREEEEEDDGREPVIHRVNVQCTAVDAIGKAVNKCT